MLAEATDAGEDWAAEALPGTFGPRGVQAAPGSGGPSGRDGDPGTGARGLTGDGRSPRGTADPGLALGPSWSCCRARSGRHGASHDALCLLSSPPWGRLGWIVRSLLLHSVHYCSVEVMVSYHELQCAAATSNELRTITCTIGINKLPG